MSTVARTEGAQLVISGAKTWISNARRSDLIALLCKTDPAAQPKHRGDVDRVGRAWAGG